MPLLMQEPNGLRLGVSWKAANLTLARLSVVKRPLSGHGSFMFLRTRNLSVRQLDGPNGHCQIIPSR